MCHPWRYSITVSGLARSGYVGSAGSCHFSVSVYFFIYVSTFSSFLFQIFTGNEEVGGLG